MNGRARIRLSEFIGSLPGSLADDVQSYLIKRSICQTDGNAQAAPPERYWEGLPGWLMNKYGPAEVRGSGNSGFIADIEWAQYCLYLHYRILDDCFDAKADVAPLIYATNLFLMEAERVFDRYLHEQGLFRDRFRQSVEESSRTIVKVGEFHRDLKIAPDVLLSGYAGSASVFTIAPAAVCIYLNRTALLDDVEEFIAEMTIAGQIMDDLSDIVEDMRRGKINYAARIMTLRDSSGHDIPKGSGRGFSRLVDVVDSHLTSAFEAARRLDLKEAMEMAMDQKEGMKRLGGLPELKEMKSSGGRAVHES
jgi:hypothetical protein